MNRLTPATVTNAMIENLYSRRWTRSSPMILPPSNLRHLPVKAGVTFERDNTSEFSAKIRKRNKSRRIQHVLGGRALDSDVA